MALIIRRQIESVIKYVPKAISDVLLELSKEVPLNEQNRMVLHLLLEEAITNAISHGNQYNPKLVVDLIVEYGGEQVVLMTIKDQGRGFDRNILPDLNESNKKMSKFGRGIFLMKQMADEIRFNDQGNEIYIRKKIL